MAVLGSFCFLKASVSGDEVDFILGELVSSILIGIGFLPELLGVCWHQAPTRVVSKEGEPFSTSPKKRHMSNHS